MLAAVDLDDKTLLKANEIKDEISKGHLSTKFEWGEPSIAQQPPHCCFGIGGLAPHFLCEVAVVFRSLPIVKCLRHNPSPGAFGATLFHKGRGNFQRAAHTRIGIST